MSNAPKKCLCGCGNETKISQKTDKYRGHIKGEPINYIKGHNLKKGRCAENHGMWNGGVTKSNGYIKIYMPGHHRADNYGYVLEHVLITEKALGKSLPIGTQIHRHTSKDNKGGLVICQDQKYHALLHQRTFAYNNSGHASWRKCWVCQEWDSPANLVIGNKQTPVHRLCRNKYQKNRRNSNAE